MQKRQNSIPLGGGGFAPAAPLDPPMIANYLHFTLKYKLHMNVLTQRFILLFNEKEIVMLHLLTKFNNGIY